MGEGHRKELRLLGVVHIVLGQRYARDKKHLFLGDRLLEDGPEGFIIPEQDRRAESP